MADFRAHVTVNTGDMWAATDQNLFVKGNWDFINNKPQYKELNPDHGFAPVGLTAALGPTTYENSGLELAWRALRFPDSTDNYWCWSWIVEEGYGGVDPVLEVWGYMSTASPGQIAFRAYLAASGVGENIYNKVFGAADSLFQITDSTQYNVIKFEVPISSGETLVQDDQAKLMIYREGTAPLDTAIGEFRYLGGRLRYNYA